MAHIGVLKVLERGGIPVHYLAGTSMGGVIAAGYAAGTSPDDLESEAVAATRLDRMVGLADPGLGRGGLIGGQRLMRYFEQLLGTRTFSDMRVPLAMVAVDLGSRRQVVLKEGPVALAVRATTAVPGLLTPVEAGGRRLVDGGVLNNLPVDVVRKMGADIVIGVDVGANREAGAVRWLGSHPGVPAGLSQALEILDDTLGAMMAAIQEDNLRQFPPDLLLRPEIPAEFNSLSAYPRASELIAIGERAAEARLSEITLLLRQSAGPSDPQAPTPSRV
jgi:NTE family protein